MRSKVEIGTVKNPKSVNLTGYRLSPTKTVFPHASFGFNPGKRSYLPNLNFYEPVSARFYTQEILSGKDFERFVEGKVGGNRPVAILSKEMMEKFGAKSQTVLLSASTVKSHPNIKLEDYRSIQSKIDTNFKTAKVISNPNNRQLFVWKEGNNKWQLRRIIC